MTISKSVPTVQLVTKTVFALKARPSIAPKGLQKGTFLSAVNETGTEAGEEFNRLIVTVALEAKDAKGQPFQVEEKYNLLPNGRGLNAFIKDYEAWSGQELTEDDLYSFDCNEKVKGPVVVEIDHRKEGKDPKAVIIAFHNPNATEQAAA